MRLGIPTVIIITAILASPISVSAAARDADGAVTSNGSRPMTKSQGDAIVNLLTALRAEIADLRSRIDVLEQSPLARDPMDALVVPENVNGRDLGRTVANPDGGVFILEFTDFECPFCQVFNRTLFETIEEKYLRAGSVRYVVRQVPSPIHAAADQMAQAAICADKQGRYRSARDLLFSQEPIVASESLADFAEAVGLNRSKFERCMASDAVEQELAADKDLASDLGVMGTPTFLVGRIENGQVISGRWFVGVPSPEGLFSELDSLLEASQRGDRIAGR